MHPSVALVYSLGPARPLTLQYVSFSGGDRKTRLTALLQNDSFIYISMHKRMKQGEKDETGVTGVNRRRFALRT
jgi:hypothetical protein